MRWRAAFHVVKGDSRPLNCYIFQWVVCYKWFMRPSFLEIFCEEIKISAVF